ncbi:Protein of unknown function (DUF3349) [Frankia torreyi]|uniref:DUF3349 domain-containing protein n=1 Tax=Frankia torreyi TaxID=1856 RepID=A0A0D8BIQ9_9ACTN|nr:Protein of unknown function (DUF3349) [Frankia torreyi]KQM07333.1 Protein of unknown function (DUF3349) [Frankia sp. CpI1-P]
MSGVALPPLLASVIQWLRAGYPDGVPERDYLPLFALLRRKLTGDEVAAVVDALAASGDSASALAIRTAIADVTHDTPLEGDIARVSARLAAGGWPLASPSCPQPATET